MNLLFSLKKFCYPEEKKFIDSFKYINICKTDSVKNFCFIDEKNKINHCNLFDYFETPKYLSISNFYDYYMFNQMNSFICSKFDVSEMFNVNDVSVTSKLFFNYEVFLSEIESYIIVKIVKDFDKIEDILQYSQIKITIGSSDLIFNCVKKTDSSVKNSVTFILDENYNRFRSNESFQKLIEIYKLNCSKNLLIPVSSCSFIDIYGESLNHLIHDNLIYVSNIKFSYNIKVSF